MLLFITSVMLYSFIKPHPFPLQLVLLRPKASPQLVARPFGEAVSYCLRVVSIHTDDHATPSKITETIKWSGEHVDDLEDEYPPSAIFGADPLGHREIENGWLRWDYRFEELEDNGDWTQIDDPREVGKRELTDIEREIEAQNRRDFPGDYLTEADDDYWS